MLLLPPKYIAILTCNIAVISFLFTVYKVEVPVRQTANWALKRINKNVYVQSGLERLKAASGLDLSSYLKSQFLDSDQHHHKPRTRQPKPATSSSLNGVPPPEGLEVFTADQLALFDGSRQSKPVYLALLGRVYNVEKGRKHYAPGGGYHFFAGRDATRAFVSGDFTPQGLTDDISGLSESELLSLSDWASFYEKEYQLVGLLDGTYYDGEGRETARFEEVSALMANALQWKEKQRLESEVFPPCNSEWKQQGSGSGGGGRVWCTTKSGGIHRDWAGVPRKLFTPASKSHRCVCVKNFGAPLDGGSGGSGGGGGGGRGDLDNPNLKEYTDCPPTASSCKLD